MFTNIYIDNYKGISKPIELSFISKSRNKEESNSIAKLEDGIYVNKIIGIIGGNASGKTSLLEAISTIGNLLTLPVIQYDLEEKIKDFDNMIAKTSEQDRYHLIHDLIKELKSSLDISFQNYRRKNDYTTFKIEMYISDKNIELTGYYTYELQLDGVNQKISKEFLGFRKKYRNKIKTIIDIGNTTQGQVYYINKYYKNIIDINKNNTIVEEQYSYIKTFINHYINCSADISIGNAYNAKDLRLVDWYKKSPNVLINLVKIVDPKIKDIIIDSDGKNEELLFVLKDESKITRRMLSTGTERFLNNMRYVNETINKNGVLLADEIEQNLHKDLVELIIRLFGEMSTNNAQIIFTTLIPEIFDITNNGKKVFKQDSVFVIDAEGDDIKIKKLMELKIDGERVKGDASVANLYKNKKISVHPDSEQIEIFLNELNRKDNSK